jgi:hypothetical protein
VNEEAWGLHWRGCAPHLAIDQRTWVVFGSLSKDNNHTQMRGCGGGGEPRSDAHGPGTLGSERNVHALVVLSRGLYGPRLICPEAASQHRIIRDKKRQLTSYSRKRVVSASRVTSVGCRRAVSATSSAQEAGAGSKAETECAAAPVT